MSLAALILLINGVLGISHPATLQFPHFSPASAQIVIPQRTTPVRPPHIVIEISAQPALDPTNDVDCDAQAALENIDFVEQCKDATGYWPKNPPAQQPGYAKFCPDGTPAQGSCETPEGVK